jgi:hypothetical protein
MRYRDGLGHVYDIPPEHVEEFERRRRPLLIAAILIKCLILAGILAIAWSN